MYGKRIRQVSTGRTGIVVARPVDGCPTVSVVPDDRPERSVSWRKDDVEEVEPPSRAPA